MEEGKVVRAPKNTWEMLWWMVFEPELLQNYSQSLTSIRLRANTILKSFLEIVLCTLAIWLLLNALLVILESPFWFSDKWVSKTILENWKENNFISNYLFLCTEKFTFLLIGFCCCFIFCLLTIIAADQPLGLVFCLFFTFSFCFVSILTPIVLPTVAYLFPKIITPFHDSGIGKITLFILIEGNVLRSTVFGAIAGLLGSMVLGFRRVSIFGWALGISYGLAIYFEEAFLFNPIYAIVVGFFYAIPVTLTLSFGTKWFGGLSGGLAYGSIFSTLFLLRSDYVLNRKHSANPTP